MLVIGKTNSEKNMNGNVSRNVNDRIKMLKNTYSVGPQRIDPRKF